VWLKCNIIVLLCALGLAFSASAMNRQSPFEASFRDGASPVNTRSGRTTPAFSSQQDDELERLEAQIGRLDSRAQLRAAQAGSPYSPFCCIEVKSCASPVEQASEIAGRMLRNAKGLVTALLGSDAYKVSPPSMIVEKIFLRASDRRDFESRLQDINNRGLGCKFIGNSAPVVRLSGIATVGNDVWQVTECASGKPLSIQDAGCLQLGYSPFYEAGKFLGEIHKIHMYQNNGRTIVHGNCCMKTIFYDHDRTKKISNRIKFIRPEESIFSTPTEDCPKAHQTPMYDVLYFVLDFIVSQDSNIDRELLRGSLGEFLRGYVELLQQGKRAYMSEVMGTCLEAVCARNNKPMKALCADLGLNEHYTDRLVSVFEKLSDERKESMKRICGEVSRLVSALS